MISATSTTIKDIVAGDFRAAAIFQQYGLDFCCGGGRSIQEACSAKGIDPNAVLTDLERLATTADNGTPKFNTWDLDLLSDYIVGNHHRFVQESIPVILTHARKVARVHGENHPETVRIAELFEKIAVDLQAHMQKEERILFPYIKALAHARRSGAPVAEPAFGSIQYPVQAMELEHQIAGNETAEIRSLSGGFTPPPDACMTFRVLYQELEAFERDLHQHVHLENNILFPNAVALEGESQGPACGLPAQ